ncbi:MAG: type III secretion system inner membrane ring subunit SctD, partial [Mailhella sp.]|nr:type III secretion system inner membrane ring subunit SctD [Mailhella sp.]
AQLMRSLLDEAGYDKLNVVPGEKSITVTGRIATDRERGRLLKLAQLLKFPVYLEVTVHSDAADAVRASFNSLGLWPEVTELPPSSRPGVRVRGYIRNGFIEEMALSTAVRNVPSLKPADGGKPALEIFSNICHEDEVAAELEPALMAAGLDDIQKVFLPGRIELRGTLTPQSRNALADAAKAVEKKLGVPIPFDIINEAEEQKPKANIYTNQGDHAMQKEGSSPPSSGFKVVSVSLGAMKFVTLETGERIFEGGELPGGYLLERIAIDALTLVKNNKTTQYPLRGSQ